MTPIVVGILVLLIFGAIALIVIGYRDSSGDDPLMDRIAEVAARGETVGLEEIELSQPLSERVIIPMLRKVSQLATRFTPQHAIFVAQHKLEMAGNPKGLAPASFWMMRFVVAIGFGAVLMFVFSISALKWGLLAKMGIVALFVGLGFFVPELMLNSMIERRQKNIRHQLPDALDLLTICVEAGLGFDGAMAKVYEKWNNELSLAFGRVIREIQLGKLRRDALHDMAERLGVAEMTSFVAAVVQSEQLGVSMAKVLRIQADQMRIKRRQAAEEEAHKAPIKMLIPLALLVFPSICIVLMTPAVLMMMRSALKGVLFGG